MSVVVNALVPVGSVLLGAGLTYWLNIRTRQRNFLEDKFNSAIAAVVVTDASKNYLEQVGRPDHMPEAAYSILLVEIAETAIENHTRRAGEARKVIAQVVQYEPRLRQFYTDAQAVTDNPEVIISLLMDARDRLLRTGRGQRLTHAAMPSERRDARGADHPLHVTRLSARTT